MAKEKENKDRYSLESVATQTEQVIYDKVEKREYSIAESMVKLLNSIEELKKLLQ